MTIYLNPPTSITNAPNGERVLWVRLPAEIAPAPAPSKAPAPSEAPDSAAKSRTGLKLKLRQLIRRIEALRVALAKRGTRTRLRIEDDKLIASIEEDLF